MIFKKEDNRPDRFIINIDTSNAIFDQDIYGTVGITNILRSIANRLSDDFITDNTKETVREHNGNKVGYWKWYKEVEFPFSGKYYAVKNLNKDPDDDLNNDGPLNYPYLVINHEGLEVACFDNESDAFHCAQAGNNFEHYINTRGIS